MILLNTLFIYTFSCAASIVYGIGYEKIFFESRNHPIDIRTILSVILEIFFGVCLSWFVIKIVLAHPALDMLFFPSTLMCTALSHQITGVLFNQRKHKTGEMVFSLGTVFLSVYEGFSFPSALLIATASILSFYVLLSSLLSVRSRYSDIGIRTDWRGAPLTFITLGLLFLALYAPDASWWFQEVLN